MRHENAFLVGENGLVLESTCQRGQSSFACL